ncbi:unnamed protein product [Phytophthora fragariaefolia]|uniref:Unnamed protein product n=1 Tax=Phytophthora fragariaefolia TaxID=1490495 RepID=A0A9W6YCC0_9STRA|nr:unnamed protein product [Phytophthora fragariaefolia]
MRPYARREALNAAADAGTAGSKHERLPTRNTEIRREREEVIRQHEKERHLVPDEGDEVRVYVSAGQGRRGIDSLVSRHPRLERLQPGERLVEVKRRRYRTRTGRYVLEFEVQRLGRSNAAQRADRMWLSQKNYEQLWQEGRNSTTDSDSEDEDHQEPQEVQQDESRTIPARGRE